MKKNRKPKSSLAKRNLQKFLQNRLAIFGAVLIILLMLASIFAPLLTSYDPAFVDSSQRLVKPCAEHPLGTDNAGRDLLARLLYGGRISIFVGIVSALGSCCLGIIVGCVSGYFGGKVDSILLYISEIFSTFPQTILVLIIVGFAGRSLANLIIIFSLTGWMGTHRIVRGRIISLREEAFVESCKACGVSKASIMFRHLLPNTLGPVIVSITLSSAGYVLSESGLSFLGLGVPPEVPTWGNIINAAKSFNIIQNYPMLWIAPGIVISLFVLGVNFFGDGLRDVFDTTQ